MQAFSQDPVMQQKANMAMQQAQHMLQVARAQMAALQQGHAPPPAVEPTAEQPAPPSTPPPSPEHWPNGYANGHHVNGSHVNGHHANGHHVNGHALVVEAEVLSEEQGQRWTALDDDGVPVVASAKR